jgi:hypothetical protein
VGVRGLRECPTCSLSVSSSNTRWWAQRCASHCGCFRLSSPFIFSHRRIGWVPSALDLSLVGLSIGTSLPRHRGAASGLGVGRPPRAGCDGVAAVLVGGVNVLVFDWTAYRKVGRGITPLARQWVPSSRVAFRYCYGLAWLPQDDGSGSHSGMGSFSAGLLLPRCRTPV